MKRIISIILTITTLLVVLSVTPIAADVKALPDNVTLKSIVCNSSGDTITAKMTFNEVIDCTVIMAMYDNYENLLKVTYEDSPTTATDFEISLITYFDPQSYLDLPVKIFFWDNLNTLKPVNVTLSGIVEPTPSSLAVIDDNGVVEGYDSDGNPIWTISYYMDGENLTADTHPDVVTSTKPTDGDVIKLDFDESGLITSIEYVWDFPSNIRDFSTNEPTSLATGDNAYIISNPDETLAGGVITNYTKQTTMATINNTEYKLSQADNIYVIDSTGRRLDIDTGSSSAFKCFPALYETVSGTLTLSDESDKTLAIVDMSIAENRFAAMKYADHVYLRTYEGKVKDVIIVKSNLYKVQ